MCIEWILYYFQHIYSFFVLNVLSPNPSATDLGYHVLHQQSASTTLCPWLLLVCCWHSDSCLFSYCSWICLDSAQRQACLSGWLSVIHTVWPAYRSCLLFWYWIWLHHMFLYLSILTSCMYSILLNRPPDYLHEFSLER